MSHGLDYQETGLILCNTRYEVTLRGGKVEQQTSYLCWADWSCATAQILSQPVQEWHNIPPHLTTNISAISSYQLNNRPTISLFILTGTSAVAAGLNQPAPTVPRIKLKGKGSFPIAFLTAFISTPQRIRLLRPAAATWLQCLAHQLHRSIIARLLAVNSGQRRAGWQIMNGGHRGK